MSTKHEKDAKKNNSLTMSLERASGSIDLKRTSTLSNRDLDNALVAFVRGEVAAKFDVELPESLEGTWLEAS